MSFNLTMQDYPSYTYKDYQQWDGDWELIRGFPYAMAPSPTWQHQNFGADFIFTVKQILINRSDCHCRVLYETDWMASINTGVRPDVMLVCEPITGDQVTITPALIVEILSPTTMLKDRNTKYNLYQAYGVKYYLIADIGKKQIDIF